MRRIGCANRQWGPRTQPGTQSDLGGAAWGSLAFLQDAYPGFRTWYWNRVLPDLVAGRRHFFIEMDEGALVGIVIAKRSDERKLCTIWTAPAARGRGTATRLVRDALCWLGTDSPLMTVPEEDLGRFKGLVRKFGFHHRAALPSLYRQGRVEHVFNGVLRPGRPGPGPR